MGELVTAVSIFVWLIMGGWAFMRLDHGEYVGSAAVICLLLAPFAFGVALAKDFSGPRGDAP